MQNQVWMVDYWNERFPQGTPVIVYRDNGEKLETVTRSDAWILGGHTAVVQVKGISGCYSLSRVAPNIACSGQERAASVPWLVPSN